MPELAHLADEMGGGSMRIRSTKPEFWRSERVASIPMEVAYDGPLPTGPKCYSRNLPGVAPRSEHVYLMFDANDALVYVGRAWRIADRLTKHRRRPWWPSVRGIVIVRVTGRDPSEANRFTRLLEALAIRDLNPSGNIAGPSLEAMR